MSGHDRRAKCAEASRTQQSADWITSHVHAVEYFGGVPAVWVQDQLRTGVTVPCRYEPGVQRTYAEWAQHYHTVVIPARPAKPRDKAKVEVAVQVAERWLLARLRHETIFSLGTLNARLYELLTALNARPMKGYGGRTRRDLFEQFDRPALQALPAERFIHADWLQARVNIVDRQSEVSDLPDGAAPSSDGLTIRTYGRIRTGMTYAGR